VADTFTMPTAVCLISVKKTDLHISIYLFIHFFCQCQKLTQINHSFLIKPATKQSGLIFWGQPVHRRTQTMHTYA